MKATGAFKDIIKEYLDKLAKEDTLFASSYAKKGKSIDNCITYILNTVKQSGCNGYSDDEIFSMAVHYYDEDNIKVGKPLKCNVVVNRTVELTEEEKQQARKDAISKYQDNIIGEMTKKPAKQKKKADTVEQPSLFDDLL